MAGGTILAGVVDASAWTNNITFSTTNEWIARSPDGVVPTEYTVTESGTADGIAVYLGTEQTAANIKLIVTDDSGNILGVTASTTLSGAPFEDWMVIDLVTPFAVTTSDVVILWFACDSGNVGIRGTGANFRTVGDDSGSYASPPDPLNVSTPTELGGQASALRLMGTGAAASVVLVPVIRQNYRNMGYS